MYAANECPGTRPHSCALAGLPQPPQRPGPRCSPRAAGGGPRAPGGGAGPWRPRAGASRRQQRRCSATGLPGKGSPMSHTRCHTQFMICSLELTPQEGNEMLVEIYIAGFFTPP